MTHHTTADPDTAHAYAEAARQAVRAARDDDHDAPPPRRPGRQWRRKRPTNAAPLTDQQKRYDEPGTIPPAPAGLVVTTCQCGAGYLDTPAGHDAHDIVFNHRPRQLVVPGQLERLDGQPAP